MGPTPTVPLALPSHFRTSFRQPRPHRRSPLAHSALSSSQLLQSGSIEQHNAVPSQTRYLCFNQTPPLKANPTPLNHPSSLPQLPPLPPSPSPSSLPLHHNGRPPRPRRLRPPPSHRLRKQRAKIRPRNHGHGELRAQLQDRLRSSRNPSCTSLAGLQALKP